MSAERTRTPAAVVIGVGPGLGLAVAARFAAAGLAVAIMSRGSGRLSALAEAAGAALAVPVDVADERALRAALDTAAAELGPPDVVVYNAAAVRTDALGELSAAEHAKAWAVNVGGAVTAAAHVLPGMATRGGGTFLVTGGLPEPDADHVSLSLGKAGVRCLVDLLDRAYAPRGVHVATVIVAGAVTAGSAFDPDDIAGHYWRLHAQPRAAWEREYVHTGR
jgi:NADP-dependent 3-hydroxy acid dehydrogenase YdfG